jgi:hypothetical protein
VWATYTADSGPYADRWQSLDLTRDPNDSTLWKGSLPLSGTAPQSIRYFVQAVNGVGLVSMASNMGVDYVPGGVTPNRVPTALALQAAALPVHMAQRHRSRLRQLHGPSAGTEQGCGPSIQRWPLVVQPGSDRVWDERGGPAGQ